MPKIRLNISIDNDLADFIKMYAQENRTTELSEEFKNY